jgi:hypothetical protein
MSTVKLSLHGTWWRLALTKSVAKGLPEDHDRLLHKWPPTPERWPGWRHAATVRVPHTSLQPGWPEPMAKPRPVEFVPPPRPGHELRFDLLLGRPDGAELVVSGASEVGQMALPSGGLLIVLAHEVAVDDAEEQRLAEQRRIMLASHTAFTTTVSPAAVFGATGWAWSSTVDGVPALTDMGTVSTKK